MQCELNSHLVIFGSTVCMLRAQYVGWKMQSLVQYPAVQTPLSLSVPTVRLYHSIQHMLFDNSQILTKTFDQLVILHWPTLDRKRFQLLALTPGFIVIVVSLRQFLPLNKLKAKCVKTMIRKKKMVMRHFLTVNWCWKRLMRFRFCHDLCTLSAALFEYCSMAEWKDKARKIVKWLTNVSDGITLSCFSLPDVPSDKAE